MPSTGGPQHNTPNAKQAVHKTTYNNTTRPARPMRATAQPQTSLPHAAKTTANQHKAPGTPRLQCKEPSIQHAGHNKTQTPIT